MNKISKSKVIVSRTKVKYNVDTEYPTAGRTRVYKQDFKVEGQNGQNDNAQTHVSFICPEKYEAVVIYSFQEKSRIRFSR